MSRLRSLWWLITLVAVPSGPGNASVDKDEICLRYESADRTVFADVCEAKWSTGRVPPATPLSWQEQDPMAFEVVSMPVTDCSNETYRCLTFYTTTYAVPRRRLKPTDEYQVNGVTFKVEKCVQGDGAVCQVALIGGYCIDDGDSGCALSSAADRPRKLRYITYFFYNEDLGVTAMGLTPVKPESIEGLEAITLQTVLQGARGILSPASR